jgi:hypothetical protein
MKARPRRRIDINLEELDQLIDRSMQAPLSASEGEKLKTVMHAMAERLLGKRPRRPMLFWKRRPLRPRNRRPLTKKSSRPDMGVTLRRRLQVPTGL